MQQIKPKTIKVTFMGDMKRMKATTDYATLVQQTHRAFGQGAIPTGFKFYYLDEDSEMVSIDSQSDLEEALEIEELTILKLTASASAKEARAQLCQDADEIQSMHESLNQSGFFTARTVCPDLKEEQKIEEPVQAESEAMIDTCVSS